MSRRRARKHKRECSEEIENDTYGIADDDKSRPYYIVEDLPCSLEPPRYDTFTTPLSVKDSAVLYTSLLNSRRTWIKAEMFQLYWSKQYMNTKEREELKKEGIEPESIDQSAARERMNKLCDCTMKGGPHQFPIRLFILKNDDVERAWLEAKEAKKREREERRIYQEEQKKLKDERRELRRQKKLEAMEKEKQKEKVKKPRKPYKKSSTKTDSTKNQPATDRNTTERKKKDIPSKSKATKLVTRAKPYEEQVMILNLNKMARSDNTLNDLMIKVAGGNASVDEIMEFKKYIEKAKSMPPPSGPWKTMFEEVDITDDEQESVQTKEHLESTSEETETSEEKNELSSNEESLLKETGAQHPSIPNKCISDNVTENNTQQNNKLPDSTAANRDLKPASASGNILNDDNIIQEKNKSQDQQDTPINNTDSSDHVENNEKKESEPDQMQTPTCSHIEDSNNDEQPSNSTFDPECNDTTIKEDNDVNESINAEEEVSSEAPKKRKYKKRLKVKSEDEEEEERSMQLTTFQQKYSNGADIVFEYAENANVRFLLPKYSIIEQLEDEESYLLSFVMIHNRREVALFTSRKLKELNKRKPKEEWIKPDDYNPFDDARCPDPLYSPITVKLSGIPKKFGNIILNSFHPTERVQQYMKSIFNRGNRLSGYNLWYELDAYDDKDLAETLRVGLKEYEQNFKNKRQKKQII